MDMGMGGDVDDVEFVVLVVFGDIVCGNLMVDVVVFFVVDIVGFFLCFDLY